MTTDPADRTTTPTRLRQPQPRSGASSIPTMPPAAGRRGGASGSVSRAVGSVGLLALRDRRAAVAGIAVAVLVAAVAGAQLLTTLPTQPARSAPQNNAAVAPAGSGGPSAAAASPIPSASPGRSPAASVAPAGRIAGAAPTTARGFRLRKTVVQIRFPLKYGARYSYRSDFLVHRVGTPLRYNHAWVAKGSTVLSRAHDGVDIQVPVGTPVLAPFDAVVIDPARRWAPWRRDRYGIAAVLESVEPTSPGYVAIVAHLSRVTVRVGARVDRGDVLGYTGRTGNAEATQPHLHFELRAPFRLPVRVAGKLRPVDAFDPYPSLVAADPKRRASATP